MKRIDPKQHQTHKENLWRFLALIVLLGAYFGYMSWKFDAATGAWLALLSWSFFVLCTPVADSSWRERRASTDLVDHQPGGESERLCRALHPQRQTMASWTHDRPLGGSRAGRR